MKRLLLGIPAVLFAMLLGAAALKTPQPRLSVYPRVALTEGVRVEWFIPRHADNRAYRVEIDGPLYRATEGQLEGNDARAIFPALTIYTLPEGEYDVRLIIQKVDRSVTVTRTTFCRGSGCFEGLEQ